MKILFTAERVTKNTIRFTEKMEDKLDTPKIGLLYVPKDTLRSIGWKDGNDIAVEINVAGKD